MTSKSRKPQSLKALARPYQSKSSVESYLRCPKLYQLKYVEGLSEGEPNERQVLGTLWHTLQETGQLAEKGNDPVHRALLEVLWAKYGEFLPSLRVKHVEITLEAEYRGIKFKGILDKIIEDDDGLWVVEHKTTQSDISEKAAYWKRLPLDIQVNLYPWLARENGYDVKGTLWDVVKIPAYKRLESISKSEGEFKAKLQRLDLEAGFKRKWYPWNSDSVGRVLATFDSTAKLIELGEFPMNSRACFWRDGQCSFVERCYA